METQRTNWADTVRYFHGKPQVRRFDAGNFSFALVIIALTIATVIALFDKFV